MATGRARVVITGIVVEYLDHDTGHWCRPCALSTGLRMWVAVRDSGSRMHLQERVYCTDCGSRDVTVVSRDDHA